MGVHGAGLVHGLFMPKGGIIIELKTLYGFQSGLFHLVADSRVGILGIVDVRDYFIKGGHKPIDAPLVSRIIHVLSEAIKLKAMNQTECGNYYSTGPHKKDHIVCSMNMTDEFDHILGPNITDFKRKCHSTLLYQFRSKLLGNKEEDLHCTKCASGR
jgi:hypothetical protein